MTVCWRRLTGTIKGNLLEAIGGTRQLPPGWLSAIELGDVIAAQR